jgi:glycosyltransferase involved in cell wall biosynthesis
MRDRRPPVSVILFCDNQQPFVADVVDGVLAQPYSPLEIVIVDDCSSDTIAPGPTPGIMLHGSI